MDKLVKQYLWSFCHMSQVYRIPSMHLELLSVPPHAQCSDIDPLSPSGDPADATEDRMRMPSAWFNTTSILNRSELVLTRTLPYSVASILQGSAVSYKCNRKKSKHTFQISASLSFITGCEYICLPCSRLNLLTHSSGIRIIPD